MRVAIGMGLLSVLVPLATACSSEAELGTAESGLEALQTPGVDCNAEVEPAYSGGQQIGTVDVVRLGEKRVALKTAHAFLQLQRAAEAEGITVSINSGFRTMSEQEYFYNCYTTRSCNNGNLAARPGYSNHQNGRALDLGGDRTALNALIERLGLDWRRTVSSEPWHYEYYGPYVEGPCAAGPAVATTPVVTPPTVLEPTEPGLPPSTQPPIVTQPAPPTQPPILDPPQGVDPYDPNNPYDPYRPTPTDPYGTPPSQPGSIPTLPSGTTPTPSTSGGIPTAPSPTPTPSGAPATAPPPAAVAPPTPVTAAPEQEGQYAGPPASDAPRAKKKKKAKAIESGCAIHAGPTSGSESMALSTLAAVLGMAIVRRRRR